MRDEYGHEGMDQAATWAWVVADGTGLWVFGAASGSPANAWALGVASSDAQSAEQLRALEAVRDSGRISLVRASRGLFEAWKLQRSRLRCRIAAGSAVTVEEHDRLLARQVPPQPVPASPRAGAAAGVGRRRTLP